MSGIRAVDHQTRFIAEVTVNETISERFQQSVLSTESNTQENDGAHVEDDDTNNAADIEQETIIETQQLEIDEVIPIAPNQQDNTNNTQEHAPHPRSNLDILRSGGVIAQALSRNASICNDYDVLWHILTHPSFFPNGTGACPRKLPWEKWVSVILRRYPRSQFQQNTLFIIDEFDHMQRHSVNKQTSVYASCNPRIAEKISKMTAEHVQLCLDILLNISSNPGQTNQRLRDSNERVRAPFNSIKCAGGKI